MGRKRLIEQLVSAEAERGWPWKELDSELKTEGRRAEGTASGRSNLYWGWNREEGDDDDE